MKRMTIEKSSSTSGFEENLIKKTEGNDESYECCVICVTKKPAKFFSGETGNICISVSYSSIFV